MILFLVMLLLLILLSVAFYTLMERKIMALNQLRFGPNKVFFYGLVQPVLDGFKLFLKMVNNPQKTPIFFYISPLISFSVMFLFWIVIFLMNLNLKLLSLLFFLGISVYSFVLSGWASFSKFGYLGGLRASSQTISYEVGLSILIVMILFFYKNMIIQLNSDYLVFCMIFPLMMVWMIVILVETNRAPFDFSEGESELISGFNVEYGSGGFVLFFLAEYSMMIFMSFLTILMFSFSKMIFLLLLFIFISMRTSFPRFRYDFLMNFLWYKILPFLLSFFLLIMFW